MNSSRPGSPPTLSQALAHAPQPVPGTDRRRLKSEELFGPAAQEVEIAHGSEVYRLRRTSLGKLILTK